MQKHRRHFSNQNDYHASLASWDWGDEGHALSELGRLRLDSFLFNRVVLTDAQFLHSRPLANLASTSRAAKIPFSRIEIRSRNPSLESTLLAFALGKDPDRPLSRHWFPAADPDGTVMQRIAARKTGVEVRTWRDITARLEEHGADREAVGRLEQFWAYAVEAAEAKKLEVLGWSAPEGFDFIEVFDGFVHETVLSAAESLQTTEGGQYFSSVINNTIHDRAQTISRLQAEKNIADSDYLVDLSTIESWYNYCYNETISIQHWCGNRDLSDRDACRAYLPIHQHHDDTKQDEKKAEKIDVPHGFMTALAKLTEPEFADAADPEPLIGWYDRGDRGQLQKAVDRFVAVVDKQSGFDHPNAVLGKVEDVAKYIGANVTLAASVAATAWAGHKVGLWFGNPDALVNSMAGAVVGAVAGKKVENAVSNVMSGAVNLPKLNLGKRAVVSRAVMARVG